MSEELRFDGKVALVTGAGGGLGRTHALLLASRGCKVVVNDLGGGMAGGGKSSAAADKVVAEIKEAGGQAVANYDSVEDGDKIVKTAVEAFGKIDIVINNAGILRDLSFRKMTQEDWDLVYRVHVLGAMRVTHAAWPLLLDQGYGRILFTASAAGIYGNFGQANYSMAKLGLAGFSNTLALEGRKKNVLVNTIAPLAGSRLTETVLPKELLDALKPEYVSPLVAYLAHESCEETGGLYEVGGGYFAKLRWERSVGKLYRTGRTITPEHVKDSWTAIAGFEQTTHPASANESFAPIIENAQKGPSLGGNEFIDVDEALGYEFPEFTSKYDERDLSIYALGVGAARDPLDDRDLQLVYELHGEGQKALPTFGVIPAMNGIFKMAKDGQKTPGMNYGFERILHGEQFLEVKRPLPTSAKLRHKMRVKNIFDKGKGAVVITEVQSFDERGDELLRNEITTFVRGAGGWGGERGPSADVNVPPERAPDAVTSDRIHENQALLYRLSGDWNPLHADPNFAGAFGFPKPILHGLCTFGYAARHVLRHFAKDGDVRYFKNIKVRFAESVFPGETLVTEMWKESPTKIIFRCTVKEREKIVISNAALELYAEIPTAKSAPAAVAPAPQTQSQSQAAVQAAPSGEPNSADIFVGMGKYIASQPGIVAKIATVYQFKLKAPDATFTVDLKSGAGSVTPGETAKPDCTLELSDADFLAMCTGKADPQKLYFGGKLKITGNVMASQKLEFLKKIDPAMVLEAMRARTGGAVSAAPAPLGVATGGAAAAEEPTIADWFGAVKIYLEEHPEIPPKVGSSFVFKVKNPDSAWTVDLKGTPWKVEAGAMANPECTFELSYADFMDMSRGKGDPQKLYFAGKLKLSGNIMAAQKLQFITKIDPEQVLAALRKARGGGAAAPAAATTGAPASAAPVAATPPATGKAKAIFAALEKRLAENQALAGDVGAKLVFKVKDPDATFTVDLSKAPGSVSSGAQGSATATFVLNDEDLTALVADIAIARSLFQQGKLRVEGDVKVAHRLGFLKNLI